MTDDMATLRQLEILHLPWLHDITSCFKIL